MACKDEHDRSQEIVSGINHAESICGSRLTDTRRAVLELLLSEKRPMTAYELLETLSVKTGRGWKPPTVYRALDFLVAQGIATRLESRNAYTICAHIGVRHACVFFLCACCGEAYEVMDETLERQLSAAAEALGFHTVHPVIEVEGKCAHCHCEHEGRPHHH